MNLLSRSAPFSFFTSLYSRISQIRLEYLVHKPIKIVRLNSSWIREAKLLGMLTKDLKNQWYSSENSVIEDAYFILYQLF